MPDPSPSNDQPAPVEELLELAVTSLGGSRRAGQVEMARAVAGAIEGGEHLLVQAGTGTGKSLGYLVPAVRHAVQDDERVVVSTATLALQRQILTHDLPLVAAALAPRLPRAPRIAVLKGWHNYACVQKVAGGFPADEAGTLFELPGEPAGAAEHPAAADDDAGARPRAGRAGGGARSGDLGAQVVRARAWVEETETGDRDDLVPGVSDRAWRQVSVTSMECLAPKCPMIGDCFPTRARALAKEADVVVTNHAMLGIAASGFPGILPEHQVLIVDEAHELTDRVTAQATAELSVATVERAARLTRRHGSLPTTDLDAASLALGAVLAELPEGRLRDGLPPAAQSAVGAVRDAARTLLSALKPAGAPSAAAAEGGIKMAASAMLELFDITDRMAGNPDRTGTDVLWCSRGDDGGAFRGSGMSRLHAAPLAVNGLIRTHLLAGRSGVLTSATLALGGSFVPLARSLGLDASAQRVEAAGEAAPAAEPAVKPAAKPAAKTSAKQAAKPAADGDAEAVPWRGLDVGSPFDYPRQGILYIAKRLPAPGRESATDAQLDEIATLITAAGGRTLGLFSSRRAATAVAEAMRERLDVPVLAQGDDQLPTLVREFAADPATCLFGTLSLWQGVDVPGPSCQLVLIDRIPFPRPDDPVRSARSEAVEAAGGNGFMQISATHAALMLAQGAGRLIRGTADRGVVAVLDPRLATARYGEFLARSLPDFWRTSDREVVVAALERLGALA
ncbi:ATP-dependent DNA helicase [Pengzhenrongella sicca]|uniref:ATP-dependent helicase DinG n=1 Tax=Pengzhenrongella sicca TaxID=2819238 RepID=A0A8A4ZFF1_9MICO|nr:ATP-dependent DNA helicase [Pengzhenrongella sicca]QTE30624.1 ATP-dependent DNA helicase [Pengzhenrongella sicca]